MIPFIESSRIGNTESQKKTECWLPTNQLQLGTECREEAFWIQRADSVLYPDWGVD